MLARKIVFAAPGTVEVQQEALTWSLPSKHHVMVETLYSLVSAGTELACLGGTEDWFPLPATPGYTSVGRVLKTGHGALQFREGDLVYCWGGHSKINVLDTTCRYRGLMVKVPEGVPLPQVPFVRMATIAMTALRVSALELGDEVAVLGLGPIGLMALQLARLQGARVVGIDLSERRLELAKALGADTVIQMGADAETRLMDHTRGHGLRTLIDATGSPAALMSALPWMGKDSEAILLGSPRGHHAANLTDLLNHVHLEQFGCVTLKGAHEWRFPTFRAPHLKHSIERNSEIVLDFLQQGRLRVDGLHTHTLPPDQAAEAYRGLQHQKDDYLGVVFDWTAEHLAEAGVGSRMLSNASADRSSHQDAGGEASGCRTAGD